MYYLYILYSFEGGKLYVGQTNDLEKRLKKHNAGKVQSTQKHTPWVLMHKELFRLRSEAMKREKFLKSLYGANFKRKILKEFLSTARQNQ